jgi:hypothetical protein
MNVLPSGLDLLISQTAGKKAITGSLAGDVQNYTGHAAVIT